jgi:putative hydrolase of the HAD superfamily
MVSVRAILLDVGSTLVFIDVDAVAELARAAGTHVTAGALGVAERAIRAELMHHAWPQHRGSGAPQSGGARFFARLLELAGADGDLAATGEAMWSAQLKRNLWRRVGPGVPEALAALGGAGIALAAVSNSEGTVEALLEDVGLLPSFATVVDSWVVGVAKPDPRIFTLTLDRLGVKADEAIMVGDSPSADIAGARAAGLRAALIDDLGLFPEVTPRFASLGHFVRDLLE